MPFAEIIISSYLGLTPASKQEPTIMALVYRGQLDDSRPSNNKPATETDLRAAIDAVLARKPVNPDQKPSIGCNIKWKPGNEPPYYG